MTVEAPLRDPVCGMSVDPALARERGLLLERGGRVYAFCRSGCLRAFQEEPEAYTVAGTSPSPSMGTLPVIDEGMRRWYESCSCCLGDAYPEIKAVLDEERRLALQPPVEPGICEVAEA